MPVSSSRHNQEEHESSRRPAVEFIFGRRAGERAWHEIRAATTSVIVVSPFLTKELVEQLEPCRRAGVQITLIASDAICEQPSLAAALLRQERHVRHGVQRLRNAIASVCVVLGVFCAAWLGVALQASVSAPFLKLSGGLLLACAGLAYSAYVHPYRYEYHWRFAEQRTIAARSRDDPSFTPMLHAKLYVIDHAVAYVGSANFTSSGFFLNVEALVRITERAVVHEIALAARSLLTDGTLRELGPDEIGRRLWDHRGRWRPRSTSNNVRAPWRANRKWPTRWR
jgi:phosphatidylserine/phosphatidylglycerophosphate/cardiolipin synthase-like enzyme